MVLLLSGNVRRNLPRGRVRHRKCPVAPRPPKLAWNQVVLVYPVGGSSLEKLHRFFYAQMRGQIQKDVDMIGIHVVDFHVYALFRGVLGQISRRFHRSGAGEQRPALQSCPRKVQPDPRV